MASKPSTNDAFARLEGREQFVRDINLLQGRVARKNVLNFALRPAARVVKRAVKAEVPVGPKGNIRRSSQIKTLRGNPPAVVVRTNFNVAPHSHLVTKGSEVRYRKSVWVDINRLLVGSRSDKRRGTTGRMTPNDFIARGFNKSRTAATHLIVQGLERLLSR